MRRFSGRPEMRGAGSLAMLFNSYAFLFAFLPLALIAYYAARRALGHSAALAALALASLGFYGWWSLWNVPLLVGSIGANWLVGRALYARPRRGLLLAGIAANLALLGVFKYAGFFLDNLAALGGPKGALSLALPLGISFFTFEQITFLVDAFRRRTRPGSALSYAVFVGFFPHLIAGPIVQHRDLGGQLDDAQRRDDVWANLGLGLAIFTVGFGKKVLLADSFAPLASGAFDAADRGVVLPLGAAWAGALAYTFQIFFDFSGYSDMATGLGRMFGYRLPVNFDAPYRSTSITDFWRRWHITLSGFLRDYLYIPLGGSRKGEARRLANLMAVMLLGGLWHGAGWTFAAWGGLHGLYLIVARTWSRRFPANPSPIGRAAAWLATFGAVVVAWTLFRAQTFQGAGRMLAAMAGAKGFSFGASAQEAAWVALGFAIVLLLPDTARLFGPAMEGRLERAAGAPRRLSWRPSAAWAAAAALTLAWSVLNLSHVSEFIYYRF
jgi:D-alanyl-lipoteichoic acid acyltransferase DltB (MBOAT superfamily)